MTTAAAMAPAFGIKVNQAFFEKLRIFEKACIDIWTDAPRCSSKKKKECELKYGKHLAWTCGKCNRK